MGVLAVGIGRIEQSLSFFKAALEANPKISQFWLSYIDAYIKLDFLEDARSVFNQAKNNGIEGEGIDQLETRLMPENSLLNRAIELRESGEYGEAVSLLEEGVIQSTKNANLYALLSHCYILMDELEAASTNLYKAKEIAPDLAVVGWNEARLLLKQHNVRDALLVAYATSERFVDDVEGMAVLGSCLRVSGKNDESLEILNEALKQKPDYSEALINRGLIKLSQEDKTGALSDLEKAHKLKPHVKQIWDLLIDLKMGFGDFSGAIDILVCMIELEPNDEKTLLSGKIEDLDKIMVDLKASNIKNIKLPVSAPFHCKLMNNATLIMKEEIAKLNFNEPKNILISNVTGKEISNSNELKELLVKQIESSVRWRESVSLMIEKGVTEFIEMGPGKVLSGLIKRIDRNVKVSAINSEEDIKLININE